MQAGVNPNTMQRALARLEEDGLLITSRTAGRNVTEDEEILRAVRSQLAEKRVIEYLENMEKLGYSSGMAADFARQFRKGHET